MVEIIVILLFLQFLAIIIFLAFRLFYKKTNFVWVQNFVTIFLALTLIALTIFNYIGV